MVLRILGLIFELIPTFLGALSAILILQKDRHYLANKLMAAALSLIGTYTFLIFLYDLLQKAWAIDLFLPLAMTAILLGAMLIFFAFQTIIHTAKKFRETQNWLPYLIVSVGYSIYLNIDRSIITIRGLEIVDTQIQLVPLMILVAMVYAYLIASLVIILKHGVKQTTGDSKRRLQIFGLGLIIGIIAVSINVVSQLVETDQISTLLDLIYFIILALSVLFLSLGFLYRHQLFQK